MQRDTETQRAINTAARNCPCLKVQTTVKASSLYIYWLVHIGMSAIPYPSSNTTYPNRSVIPVCESDGLTAGLRVKGWWWGWGYLARVGAHVVVSGYSANNPLSKCSRQSVITCQSCLWCPLTGKSDVSQGRIRVVFHCQ